MSQNQNFKRALTVTGEELIGMTRPQVDELWSELDNREADLMEVKTRAVQGMRRDLRPEEARMSFSDLIARAQTDPVLASAWAAYQKAEEELQALDEGPVRVFEGEWKRFGTWTQAFVVTDGHVHNTMRCSSCNKGEYRTRFTWKIEYSGKSEEEIVEAAGHRACTICYPSAPVAKGLKAPTSVMFTPEELDRDAERRERDEKKAVAAAKKAAKAIADEDGSALTVYTWTKKAHQKQTRAGALVDVPAQEFSDTLATVHAARGWLTDRFESRGDNGAHRDTQKVARAVAAKEGKTVETVLAEARERARKRR